MIVERGTRVINLVQAVNEALDLALERDPRVVLFGEDVGKMGGVFRASDGLQPKYGEKRVFDTPLAESGIVGFAIGMAMAGLRPVAEIQFAGFLYPALDQILSHLGRMRHRTRGRFTIPLVIRAPYGGGVKTPEQHADSPEAILCHVPGVKVIIPSSPERAKGLLLAAIEDPDPVFFLEAIKLYRGVKAEVPEGYYTLPIGKARVVREGNAATLIAYGGMVEVCQKAAEVAAHEGVELEVIDAETLVPLDTPTLVESVAKTGRAVVVYEAMRTGGFGAEIAARLAEEALDYLEAPVVRVAGWDAPYPPFSAVENFYRPDAKRVLEAVRRVLMY
ncbi:alpha-ketoacid dehydrogenase subunit beta [Calidithermus timidus]|jgi:pyruvate dehydrogenase E1 component beta subunit|uniref:alpha-ketoacid dehydrogenase subunit beta n=1 Tax=Calidithermus timidus TaxID=307124 RepID=UPI0003823242|nr:alpha-ketoacid dehydrogenase subunit beta [Calidithermus timidus]